MIVKDAEGGTKFIQIDVFNAKNTAQAKEMGLKIANSPLFKTMCYGENPNFGRIASSCGAVKSDFDIKGVDIYINNKQAVRAGEALPCVLTPALLRKKDIRVKVDLNAGVSNASIYTSDLSPEYVKINAAYS